MVDMTPHMNDSEHSSPSRQIVTNILAVAGFIALVALGIWLAVYATRFVPSVVDGIGSAAVSLGSVFKPSPESSLSVVPPSTSTSTATTISSFGTTTVTATSSTVVAPPVSSPAKPVPVKAGPQTTGTYAIGGSAAVPGTPYGFPDLVVQIHAVGYLASTSADSFIASTTPPAGSRPAVSFTIKNVGTNATGSWRFSASIPTRTAYIFESQPQQTLSPGDSIDYTLGFDQAIRGSNQPISITADFLKTVAESDENNNRASASLTIL